MTPSKIWAFVDKSFIMGRGTQLCQYECLPSSLHSHGIKTCVVNLWRCVEQVADACPRLNAVNVVLAKVQLGQVGRRAEQRATHLAGDGKPHY